MVKAPKGNSPKNEIPQEKPMSPLRERLWPIYNHEMRKFIPMVIIMFCVLFNYTTIRNIKDSLILASTPNGNLVIPWLKTCYVLPASVMFLIAYAKLSNVLSKEKLYWACLVPFGVFFFLFGAFMFPNRWLLQASPETVMRWKEQYPAMKDFMPTVGYWCYTLFYVMAELWGNVGVNILFWQFANQVTRTNEAKRFYPLFGFCANLSLVCAGLLSRYSEDMLRLPAGTEDFAAQMKLYTFFLVVCCCLVGFAYWWLNTKVLTDPAYAPEIKTSKKKKPKMSLAESFKYIVSSNYMICITIMVLAYGMTINITEVLWKGEVSKVYMGERAVNAFFGDLYIVLGVTTMMFTLFSKNFIRLFGWTFAASLTPWIVIFAGGTFFTFLIFKSSSVVEAVCLFMGTTPLVVAVWAGFIQNVFCRGSKYALFDPTKEMVYIPLDEELKVKGKAAVDLTGSRAAKSGGGIIIGTVSSLLNAVGAQALLIPIVAAVSGGICAVWLYVIKKLSALYQEKLKETEGSSDV